MLSYERDGAAIYRESFSTIRAEADLSATPGDLEAVVVRMIHACGMTDLPALVAASPDFPTAARSALRSGAPILTDSMMVANGVTRSRLPADNPVLCTLHDPGVPEDARDNATTRSAAAVDRWLPHLDGAVAVVGNAPTALFRLLELILDGQAHPAAIIGLPVGFVGAAESKDALRTLDHRVPYLVVRGRRGGSAMAAAAVNALASDSE
ncbi:MAG: precorrin-8X methylmutase [Acidimicrobiales bacterium]